MLSEQNCSVKVFKIEHPAHTHALKISHGTLRRVVRRVASLCNIDLRACGHGATFLGRARAELAEMTAKGIEQTRQLSARFG
jgi:hypothetical protein